MESRERFIDMPSLPEGLSVDKIPEKVRPTIDDWKEFQGGMPKIEWLNGLNVNVIHNYVNPFDSTGTGVVVLTSIPVVESWSSNKTVRFRTSDKRIVEFPVAMVWAKHGKPCELRSRDKYQRIPVYDSNRK